MTRESASLYFREGNSDKEYHVEVVEMPSGFVVNCAWGRRGGTLQTGTKTQSPVPLEKAKAIFDKLVRKKTVKGYLPGAAGTHYQATENEQRATGILPQLLNPIDEQASEGLIRDSDYWMQEKFDGKRMLIRREKGLVSGINRRGLIVPIPKPIETDVEEMDVDFVLDGEAIGDSFYAFDLLSMNSVDLREFSYSERLRQLECLLAANCVKGIRGVATMKIRQEKIGALEKLKSRNAEGVVFKRHDAPYVPGRPASGGSQLKLKFYATASCIVSKVNAKRSVAISLLDASKEVGVGNVTIPANHSVPKKGAIVEIKYLYAYPQGALFQPIYLGLRDDIEPNACAVGQLKFKAESDDDEA